MCPCCKPTGFSLIAMVVALVAAGGFAAFSDDQPKSDAKTVKSDPYPLDTCIVSGEKLGTMGKPVVKEYDGREVRFCCNGCVKQFEDKKAEMFKKIDEKIVAQQLPHYPLKNCVVMSEDELTPETAHGPVNYVYKNRLVRFCCGDCVADFNKNPAPFLKKIDEAVIKEQKPDYPLDVDVVTGDTLGDESIDRVYGVTLVRFANEDSVAKFNADPLTYTAKLREAWMSKHPDSNATPIDKSGKDPKNPQTGHDHG